MTSRKSIPCLNCRKNTAVVLCSGAGICRLLKNVMRKSRCKAHGAQHLRHIN